MKMEKISKTFVVVLIQCIMQLLPVVCGPLPGRIATQSNAILGDISPLPLTKQMVD
jgi:hypothetical protein